MFFDEVFLDKDVDESYPESYDRMMDLASRIFVDDSVDADRKKEIFCYFVVLMGSWMILNKKKRFVDALYTLRISFLTFI